MWINIAMTTVFYQFAVHKHPNFPKQDRLEIRLVLLGHFTIHLYMDMAAILVMWPEQFV